MYKKIVLLISVGLVLFLSSCVKDDKKSNTLEGEITRLIIRYYSDSDRKLLNKVEIDLTDDGAYIKYSNSYDETENKFVISNIDEIKDFVEKNILEKRKNVEGGKSDNSDEKKVLWRIRILTEEDSCNYSGFDEYPEYWQMLWELIVNGSSAENISEFRVEE